jgi:transcription elongation factor Elf1
MSSLHDFLGQEPEAPQPETRGVEIEMGYMCPCGSSDTRCFSKDRFKTSTIYCQSCGKESKMNIPEWLREALT